MAKDLVCVTFQRAVGSFRSGEVGGIDRKRFEVLAAAGAVRAYNGPKKDKAVKAPPVKK